MKTAVLIGLSVVCSYAADLEQARKLYERTEYDASLRLLQTIPQKDGAAYYLAGQNYFMTGDYKQAAEALEKAVACEPRNSDYVLWLGRTYGRKAEMANPFSALAQATKARRYFEKAVELDPRNIEALNDLLEFYMEAPSLVGGGTEKAKATVERIGQVDAAEGQWAQSHLDEKRKQWASAEEHLRRAVDLAPHQAWRLVDLAKFLARQGRYQEAEQNFARAAQLAPEAPKLLYARADAYVRSHRNLEVAKSLLERYLKSDITPEDPPKAEARKLLRQIEGS